MEKLLQTLQEYGFTDKESKVYMTVLSLGMAPVSSIARNAKYNRTTVYSILKELQKKQVVLALKKNNSVYFSVVSPDIILKQIEEKYQRFKAQMPEFMLIAEKLGTQPKVQFFEGIEGMKAMYEDLLKSETTIHSFLGVEHINKELQSYLNKSFIVRRIKNNIYAKVILSDSPKNQKYADVDKKAKKESRIIKDLGFSIQGEINLYGPNSVGIALFNDREMSGLIIYSETLYDTLKSIFTYMWDK